MKTKWDKSGRFLTLSLKILISWFLKPLRHLLMKDIYKKRFSNVRFFGKNKPCTNCGGWNGTTTEYGHPERAFFEKFETFGLGQTNWAEILWGILSISGQTVSTILAQWVPCPWERVAGSLFYKKLWFLGLKHTTPKSSQNKILAVKNLWNSVRTFVFGDFDKRTAWSLIFFEICLFWYLAHSQILENTL